jgi:hypothetical protein
MKIGPVIRPKNGHNKYCGPGALSIITRIDTAQAAALLRKVSGKPSIKGAHDADMKTALREKGYRATQLIVAGEPTLAQWLKRNTVAMRGTKVFLITAGNHYVVVQGRSGGCNQTGGPGPLAKMKMRRGRVTSVVQVDPPTQEAKAKIARVAKLKPFATMDAARANLDKLMTEKAALDLRISDAAKRIAITRDWLAQEGKRKARNSAATARRRAQSLAAEWGVEIEVDQIDRWSRHIWVTGPKAVYPGEAGDPYEGDHIAIEWDDVLDRVKVYVEDIQAKQKEGAR